MSAPFFPGRSVEDAALRLIEAADALQVQRRQSERIAAGMEARWVFNRQVYVNANPRRIDVATTE